jgi:hypothetical protein
VAAPIDPSLLCLLPETYARVLRLRLMGWGDRPIAHALDIEVDALPMLERIAAAKLAVARGPGAIE